LFARRRGRAANAHRELRQASREARAA
jgi:hypothetical protein